MGFVFLMQGICFVMTAVMLTHITSLVTLSILNDEKKETKRTAV